MEVVLKAKEDLLAEEQAGDSEDEEEEDVSSSILHRLSHHPRSPITQCSQPPPLSANRLSPLAYHSPLPPAFCALTYQ
jgi:hypothetical protein